MPNPDGIGNDLAAAMTWTLVNQPAPPAPPPAPPGQQDPATKGTPVTDVFAPLLITDPISTGALGHLKLRNNNPQWNDAPATDHLVARRRVDDVFSTYEKAWGADSVFAETEHQVLGQDLSLDALVYLQTGLASVP